jgi:repressor LexA
MKNTLPPKQRNVLEAIRSYWDLNGVPPSISVLATHIGISKATAYEHLLALKKIGVLEHIERAGRTWRLSQSSTKENSSRSIPLLGRVAAGVPILAAENIDEFIEFNPPNTHDAYFALKVQGESMIDAHILPGDIVILRQQNTARNGDIVVALVDNEEATVKEFKSAQKQVLLLPRNSSFKAIELTPDRVQILGKVIEIRRKLVQ